MNNETLCQQFDFLLLPDSVASKLNLDAIEQEFIQPLGKHRLERISYAGHTAIVAISGDAALAEGAINCPHVIRSGFWPDAPGIRVELNSDKWEIESDYIAISPVYYALNTEQRLLVSTRGDVLAAIVNARLNMDAIVEHLRLGFLLDDHSLFEGVHRIRDGERIVVSPAESKVLPPTRSIFSAANINRNWSDEEWVPAVAAKTADFFQRGMAIQLSGGVDSRLVLALGIQGGQIPAQAITLGDKSSEEVEIAQAICERYGIEHIVIPFANEGGEWLLDDAKQLAALHGYASTNAATYASFLRMLREREAFRKFPGEVGGLGGECAYGMYYTSFDKFFVGKKGLEQWVKYRLATVSPRCGALFPGDAWRSAEAAMLDRLVGVFAEVPGSLRRKADAFYVRQRMRNWAGAVIQGDIAFYWAAEPFITVEHLRWAETLPTTARYKRKRQMQTIYDIDPWLADLKYSEGRQRRRSFGGAASHLATSIKRSFAKASRILLKKSVNRESHAQSSSQNLMTMESVQQSLRQFATELPIEADQRVLEGFQQSPGVYEQELGMLLSVAWGWESVKRYKAILNGECKPVA